MRSVCRTVNIYTTVVTPYKDASRRDLYDHGVVTVHYMYRVTVICNSKP